MKKVKLLFSSSLFVPLAVAPFITSCSCAADQQTINLINRINTAFNNTDPAILSATSVADATVAETEYGNNVLNNTESKQNEILFACFNFVVAKGLTINGFNCTPSGKSFYDLFNDGCIQMNSAYNMNVEAIENNRFEFQLQGWLNCIYTRDNGDFKYGDYVQFAYDIEANAYVNLVATENTGYSPSRFYMSVSLEFDPANLSKSFGFIKYKTKGAYHQTLSINDMADVNYDTTNHWGYNRGYYNKQ